MPVHSVTSPDFRFFIRLVSRVRQRADQWGFDVTWSRPINANRFWNSIRLIISYSLRNGHTNMAGRRRVFNVRTLCSSKQMYWHNAKRLSNRNKWYRPMKTQNRTHRRPSSGMHLRLLIANGPVPIWFDRSRMTSRQIEWGWWLCVGGGGGYTACNPIT